MRKRALTTMVCALAVGLVSPAVVATASIPDAQAAPATVTFAGNVGHVTVSSAIAEAARRVHSMADFRAASPAVRRFIQTPVSATNTTNLVNEKTGAVIATRTVPTVQTAHGPEKSSTYSGWRGAWPPGCYSWQNYYSTQNAYGWTLVTVGYQFNNWCWNGSSDYTTPNAAAYANTHWGWGYCGLNFQYENWVQQGWGWQASGEFAMTPDPTCTYQVGIWDIGQVWGNGHYNWNDYGGTV